MAKPIKETPVLHGRDAQRFERIIKKNETRKVAPEDYERARRAFYDGKFKVI